MAHGKISIIRHWRGPVPKDRKGQPIPRHLWPRRRKFTWDVRWYDSMNKRLSKSFTDRQAATDFVKEIQSKVDSGKADKPAEISLINFVVEHELLMAGQLAYTTVREHLLSLNRFSEFLGGATPLSKITPRDAEAFVAYRLQQGLAIPTVNKDIRVLKSIFNLAIEPRGYLPEDKNPFAKLKQRKVATPAPRYVTQEDFQRVLHETPNLWWKTLLTLAYTSGGRRDELLNMTWADIDFENQTVRFAPKKESKFILAWQPKDCEMRTIPVPSEMLQHLADMQSMADERSPYIFLDEKRLQRILERRRKGEWRPDYELINNLLRSLNVILRRANVDIFTLHDLRRSCITNWGSRLPIQTVQYLAGHSNMETTRKYYLSIRPDDMATARTLQSELLRPLPESL